MKEYKTATQVAYWDDFETGDFSRSGFSTAGPVLIVTDPVHSGKYAFSSNGGSVVYYQFGAGTTFPDFYLRAYLRFSVIPGPNTYNTLLVMWSTGFGDETGLVLNTFGGTFWRTYELTAGVNYDYDASAIVANQYYCVELERLVGTPGRLRLWVDEVVIGDETPNIVNNTNVYRLGTAGADFNLFTDDSIVAEKHIGLFARGIKRPLTRNLRNNRLHSGNLQYIRRF